MRREKKKRRGAKTGANKRLEFFAEVLLAPTRQRRGRLLPQKPKQQLPRHCPLFEGLDNSLTPNLTYLTSRLLYIYLKFRLLYISPSCPQATNYLTHPNNTSGKAIMAPANSYAKTTLPFPIFAAEFDPYSRGYLVVGGGGGEGRSGVPNQIVSITSLSQSFHRNYL